MSDLTEAQRIERARRAEMALEEFINPAMDVVHAEYLDRLKQLSSREPWAADKIAALANAARIVEEVHSQIMALVHDGEHAKAGMIRAERIADMSPAKRRWAKWVPV